ncbi:RNA polymerase sigma factor [Bacillus sp. S/N-304-OC-R1]|uniref:RNA polymerase sigma factor n=1 Tax=Bacillus sp. S/N-304-OC-R1 TaxID=2758034 RepID=UPI001C8CF8AB|nr:RNA polymerase sigma factor [Bacillus sp. S/N-304-OC-R1]MBY0122041.1 RNA polymerase sigma factor [Bacillus sp. S/N-304-OC-R1]
MDQDKLSQWFYEYSNDIYQFLIYYIGSHDVEDLVQEVFIRAIKGYKSFEEKSSPKTWLFSIARYVGIDEIRKNQRKRMKDYLLLKSDEWIDEKNPEASLHLNETNKELYSAIRQLKKTYRDVIILRGIKELSISETAEVLNWSEGKVRLTFHRAIKALQKEKERFM